MIFLKFFPKVRKRQFKVAEPPTRFTKGMPMKVRYAVVIEKAGDNYSAYAPDLPGCIATGATVADTENEMREAIRMHLDGLREDGLPCSNP